MAQKFTVPITVKQLASAGSDAVTVYVDQDTFSRLKVEAGGRLTWGSGASAGDVNLYRASADVLQTDDTFKTPTLFVDNIEIDPTGAVTNDVLVFDGSRFTAASVALGGGGASLTVSDTAPASPEEGDLWFNSSNAKTYVYYDSSWVEVGASGGVATLDDIGDVNAPSPSNGDYLQWDGSTWTAASVASISSIDDIADVVVVDPEKYQTLVYDGAEWINEFPTTVSLVNNAEATTLQVGEAVYLFGNVGNHASVKRADNDGDATSAKTVGLVAEAIPAGENGPVVTRGYVTGIDLSTGYTAGQTIYLGENGGFTTTKPYAPEHLVYLGVIVRATNNGIIYVTAQNGYELDEIHDVDLITNAPVSGDFLKYNGTLWVNDQINLGTDTVGDYVSSVTAGTGISVDFTPSEGAGASVSLNATLDNLSDVTAPSPVDFNPLIWDAYTSQWVTNSQNITLGVPGTTDFSTITSYNAFFGMSSASDGIVNISPNGFSATSSSGNYIQLGASNITFSNGTDAFVVDPFWATSGQVLAFTPGFGSGGTFSPTTPTLDFLSDVSVTSPSAGNVLTYNGSAWTAASAGGGGASVTVSETPPASPSSGDLWFESDTTRTYVYYDSFWVEVGGLAPTAIVSDTAPSSPVTGQVWFNSLNGGTYIYYSSAWTEVGAVPVNNLLNLLDAKGDMFVGSADNTAAKLSVGTTGQVLMVDPAATYGVKWAVIPPSGGLSTSTEGAIMTMAIGA